MALAKAAIAAGGVLNLAYFLGAIGFDPAILIGALAAIEDSNAVLQRTRPTFERRLPVHFGGVWPA